MRISDQLTDKAVLTELGQRLERRRIDAALTQAQLAQEAGISKRTLERIESGVAISGVLGAISGGKMMASSATISATSKTVGLRRLGPPYEE